MLRCTTAEQVIAALSSHRDGVVAVDGFQASGKSTLARALGAALGLPVLHVDDYLHRNQGAFFDHVDLRPLAADAASSRICIVEGLCCLKVLKSLGLKAAALVYVKRMAVWGWADEDELDQSREHYLPPLPEQADPLAKSLRTLWQEATRYHAEFRPHELATVIFERSEA